MGRYYDYFPKYVPVAERRANAAKTLSKLSKNGKPVEPVVVEGRAIARTFWGKAWCDHIEQLADFESRLSRGKTYVRNGSVCHLGVSKGKVEAKVIGSQLYNVTVGIEPLAPDHWAKIKRACAGQMTSVVELLQGTFSTETMKILTDPESGMFPDVEDFDTSCNCPDYVRICKHLAAVLYGIGARLDTSPELLFTLRGVDPTELLQSAESFGVKSRKSGKKTLDADALGDVFGIDLAPVEPEAASKPVKKPATRNKRPKAE